jgi:hypothetical protein
MGDISQQRGLRAIASLWLALVPILTATCAVLLGPVVQRIQLFHPGFPHLVTMATYSPSEYVGTLALAGPLGLAAVSGVLGVFVLAAWRWPKRYSLFLASIALALNILFLATVLAALVLELLRAFPFASR